MAYIVIIAIIIIAIVLWFRQTVKKTVVQPVINGELTGPFLSEKSRYKTIKEDHGLVIGLAIGLLVTLFFSCGLLQ
jgi:hypothetical protein